MTLWMVAMNLHEQARVLKKVRKSKKLSREKATLENDFSLLRISLQKFSIYQDFKGEKLKLISKFLPIFSSIFRPYLLHNIT